MLVKVKSPWRGFKTGTLLAIDIKKLVAKSDDLDPTVLFTPSERVSLDGFSRTKTCLIVRSLDNVKSKVAFWKYDG